MDIFRVMLGQRTRPMSNSSSLICNLGWSDFLGWFNYENDDQYSCNVIWLSQAHWVMAQNSLISFTNSCTLSLSTKPSKVISFGRIQILTIKHRSKYLSLRNFWNPTSSDYEWKQDSSLSGQWSETFTLLFTGGSFFIYIVHFSGFTSTPDPVSFK